MEYFRFEACILFFQLHTIVVVLGNKRGKGKRLELDGPSRFRAVEGMCHFYIDISGTWYVWMCYYQTDISPCFLKIFQGKVIILDISATEHSWQYFGVRVNVMDIWKYSFQNHQSSL